MGVIVAEGEVVVTADAAGLGRDITKEVDKAGNGAESSGRGIGGKVFGGVIGAWAAIGAAEKITGFLGESIMAGSDYNETISKSSAIFGQQAGAMESWASTATTSLGLSKSAALASAAGFGDMFSQIGFTGDAAATMSQSVVQAAADLGSFSNLDTADVSDRISAAFRGEYDSLQAVIPNINAARVESEALAATGKKTAKELTAQEKATAVMAIVTKDGSRAMGDFGRTSGGFANQMKIASAQTEDLKGRLGSALQPALQGVAGLVTGTVMPALLSFTDVAGVGIAGFFGTTLPGIISTVGPALAPLGDLLGGVASSFAGGFSAFLGPLADIGAQLIPTFIQLASSVSPFGIVLQGLAPIAGTIGAALGQVATTVGSALLTNLTTLTPVLTTVATALSSGIATILPVIVGLLPTVATLFGTIAGVVSQVLAAVLPLVATLIGALMPIFAQLVTAVVPVVASLVGLVATAIVPLVNTVMSVLVPVITALLPVITTVFGVIVTVISSALKIVQGIIQVVTGIITGNWSQVWKGMQNIVGGVWGVIKGVVGGAINVVKSLVSAGVGVVKGVWSGAWTVVVGAVNSAKGLITGAVTGLVSGVKDGIGAVSDFFGSIPEKITGAVSGVGDLLVNVGSNVISGFINGAKSMTGKIRDAVLGPIKDSVDAVKNFLGIASPSRLFRNEIGVMMGRGLMGGFDSTVPALTSSLVGGVASAVSAVSSTLPSIAGALTATVAGGAAVGGSLASSSPGAAGNVVNVSVDVVADADPIVAGRQIAREIARNFK